MAQVGPWVGLILSTFLQLCKDTRRECGISGTGPATVVGLVGELERVVAWVSQSYRDLQGRHPNWSWMRSTFTVSTSIGVDAYAYGACTDTRVAAPITRFSRWLVMDDDGYLNITIYLSSGGVAGEGYLIPLNWDNFRLLHRRGTQNNGQPGHMTVDPQDKLVLGPKPDAVYVVNGEYQMSPQVLALNDDVPEMPSQFHDLIVYGAMQKYAAYESAPEVMARGVRDGNRLLRQLEVNQLPSPRFVGAMA